MIHPFDCHAISAFAASFFIKPDVCQINLAHLSFSLHLNLCFSKCAIPFFRLFHILAVRRDVWILPVMLAILLETHLAQLDTYTNGIAQHSWFAN